MILRSTLTSVDGVFAGDFSDSNLISEIDSNHESIGQLALPLTSKFGRGGMQSKLKIAQRSARIGIETFIANGKRDNIIEEIIQGNFIGTRFKASDKLSNIRRWLAYGENFPKGEISIDNHAVHTLKSNKSSNLLPVGIVNIKGSFEKGDLVLITDVKEHAVGIGLAKYGRSSALPIIGKSFHRPIVQRSQLYMI